MVSEQCLYIHPLYKSRPRDQTKRRPRSGDENDLRLFRYYHGTAKKRQLGGCNSEPYHRHEDYIKLRIFDIKEELSTLTVTAFVKECYNK